MNITNKLAKEIYENAGIENPSKGFEVSPKIKNAVLMQTKNCLRKLAGMCKNKDVIAQITNDAATQNNNLYLQDSYGNKYPLRFDCKNCIMEILNYE